MSAAAIAADPAIVSAKAQVQKKSTPAYELKVDKYKASATIARVWKGEGGAISFPDVDAVASIVVHTTADNEYVVLPRAAAKNIPGLKVPDAPAASTEDDAPKPQVSVVNVDGLYSSALIAINQWIEKKGVSGASTANFSNPITHTEVGQITPDEWERDFSKHLFKSGEAIIGCINFGEKNNMKGLQQFATVALSCALRGKSEHEMVVAMGRNEDAFSKADIDAGRAANARIVELTQKRN